jgi:hypothetical protein
VAEGTATEPGRAILLTGPSYGKPLGPQSERPRAGWRRVIASARAHQIENVVAGEFNDLRL